jgi:hypothetical protein
MWDNIFLTKAVRQYHHLFLLGLFSVATTRIPHHNFLETVYKKLCCVLWRKWRQSQCPRGLMRGFAAVRKLELQLRIPLEAWAKPGKDPKKVKSYRPISLLPILAKLLEKLILRRIDSEFSNSDWIPHHQFGFRRAHSTIQQCHRVTHTILSALNNKEYCTAVFLDVSQAFDMVWHPGLLYKIKQHLPAFYPPLKSYLGDRYFRTRVKGEVSTLFPIKSGVPQDSVLGPLL